MIPACLWFCLTFITKKATNENHYINSALTSPGAFRRESSALRCTADGSPTGPPKMSPAATLVPPKIIQCLITKEHEINQMRETHVIFQQIEHAHLGGV